MADTAHLVIGQTQQIIALTQKKLNIGRIASGEVDWGDVFAQWERQNLEVPPLSRHHAQISYHDDRHWIQDLGSTNGTFLNGDRLPPHEEKLLQDGDRIGICQGDLLTLTFHGGTVTTSRIAPTVLQTPSPTHLTPVPTAPHIQRPLIPPLPTRGQQWIGYGLIGLGSFILLSSLRVGMMFSGQVILLWIAGIALLVQNRYPRSWGWGAILAGMIWMLLSGRVFAYASLWQLLLPVILWGAGYYLLNQNDPSQP